MSVGRRRKVKEGPKKKKSDESMQKCQAGWHKNSWWWWWCGDNLASAELAVQWILCEQDDKHVEFLTKQ